MKKGISPAVSYVLLLVVGSTMAILAFTWGQYEITKLKEIPIIPRVESEMTSIGRRVKEVSTGDINFTTVFDVDYTKGNMFVDQDKDWIKYTASIQANVYPGEINEVGLGTTCDDDTYLIEDPVTQVKMSRIANTNVFRGARGSRGGGAQFVEIVACFDDIQINANPNCKGKSGPTATMTMKYVGYNSSASKPIVEVGIC
jgi:hypothetical protein